MLQGEVLIWYWKWMDLSSMMFVCLLMRRDILPQVGTRRCSLYLNRSTLEPGLSAAVVIISHRLPPSQRGSSCPPSPKPRMTSDKESNLSKD